MWQAYKYCYYWLYTWNRGLWGTEDVPEFNALLGLTLSLICNVYSFVLLLNQYTGVNLLPEGIPKITIGIVALILIGIHYLAFMHKGKYKQIEKEFSSESKEDRRKKGRWVVLYTFGSIGLFVFLMFFGGVIFN